MVCNILEAAFVPMENISSCTLCLCSIGLLGIWSVNPLKLQNTTNQCDHSKRVHWHVCFIHEAENRECQRLESLLAEVERNLSISDSAGRRLRQSEKNEIFTVKLN
jgi:hypothetical protein